MLVSDDQLYETMFDEKVRTLFDLIAGQRNMAPARGRERVSSYSQAKHKLSIQTTLSAENITYQSRR
jgi:hypothetical protein